MFTLNRSLTVLKSARTCFFLLGFAIAAWAPLVPYIQKDLSLSKVELSLMILTMGLGSIIGMLIATFIVKVKGTRFAVFVSGTLLCLALIAVAARFNFVLQFFCVLVYGFAMGCMEVAVNLYGSFLEKKFKAPLLSGFHGFYSIGQIFAVLIISLFLTVNFSPLYATAIPSLVVLGTLILASFALDSEKIVSDEPFFVLPKGFVIMLALIALSALTAEGAMIDWAGLLLIEKEAADPQTAANGYLTVVVFMAVGRFSGSMVLKHVGAFLTLLISVIIAAAALMLVSLNKDPAVIYAALAALGLSLANILPLAVSYAGRQKYMPQTAAVAAVSTCGYAAITFGPALIGSIGTLFSLSGAFAVMGIWLLLLASGIFLAKKTFN